MFCFFISYASLATEKDGNYYESKGYVLWDIKTQEEVKGLAFDDGLHATYTPQVLDLLAKHDAKSTFFAVGGYANRFPNPILRQVQDSHEIANHMYTHL